MSRQGIGSDLNRVDAHVVTPAEYEEIPELDDTFFNRAVYRENGVPAPLPRRGRPKSERAKVAVKLRLDQDVLEGFRATGPGWQTRMNAALRDALAGRR